VRIKTIIFCLSATAGIVLLALLNGCASTPFSRANCERFRHNGYNVLACDDDAVGKHCARGSRDIVIPHKWHPAMADNGKIVDYLPRACFHSRPWAFGRKPNIIIGRSHLICLSHEICHFEHPGRPDYCENEYPCVGDRGSR
jgi:hypothetical protein